MTRKVVILLEDVKSNKDLDFDGATVILGSERKNKFTCYVCMAKFSSVSNLSKHKALHSDSELEEDTIDEEFVVPETPKTKSDTQQVPKPSPTLRSSDVAADDSTPDNAASTETEVCVNSPYRCDFCDVFFESADDAKLHAVHKECRFACRICNRKFNTLYAFVIHVMQHRSDSVKSKNPTQMVYTCTTCQQSFDNCLLLRSHELNAHTLPSNSAPPSSPQKNSEPEAPPTSADVGVTIKTEPEDTSAQEISTPVDISCELCYDVFDTAEQLKSHMEFHEQLENKADTITVEDDDEVEVYEMKKDVNEIVATIKSKPKPAPPKLTGPFPGVSSVHTPIGASKQNLTKAIKEMLTPKTDRNPRSLLKLPSIPTVASKQPQSTVVGISTILPTNQSVSSPSAESNLELRKTGPYSFALHYKANSTAPSAVPTMTVSTSTTGSLTPTVSRNNQIQNISNTVNASANTTNMQLIISNIPCIQGVTTNTTTNATSVANSSTAVGNVTYVVSPSNRPFIVNDANNQLAYVILPHANNAVLNATSSVMSTGLKPILPAKSVPTETRQKKAYTTATTVTTCSATKTYAGTKEKMKVIMAGNNAATTSTSKPTNSVNDQVIVIDSDSSTGGNSEENATKDNSDAESDELVIDETSPTKEGSTEEKEDASPKTKLKFPAKCDGCSVVFQRMRSLRHHQERKHRCKLCQFRCCKICDMKQHYILEHRKFFCSRCSFLADTKRRFTEHNRNYHICQTCNGFYSNIAFHTCAKLAETEKTSENGVEKPSV